MIKEKIVRIITCFKNLSPTLQGMIILGVLLIIGIIIRWDYVSSEIMRGFGFFNGK